MTSRSRWRDIENRRAQRRRLVCAWDSVHWWFTSVEIDIRSRLWPDQINSSCNIRVPTNNACQLGSNLLDNKLREYIVGRCWHPDGEPGSMWRPIEPSAHSDTHQCHTFAKLGKTCSLTGVCSRHSYKAICLSTIPSGSLLVWSRTLSTVLPLVLCGRRSESQGGYWPSSTVRLSQTMGLIEDSGLMKR